MTWQGLRRDWRLSLSKESPGYELASQSVDRLTNHPGRGMVSTVGQSGLQRRRSRILAIGHVGARVPGARSRDSIPWSDAAEIWRSYIDNRAGSPLQLPDSVFVRFGLRVRHRYGVVIAVPEDSRAG